MSSLTRSGEILDRRRRRLHLVVVPHPVDKDDNGDNDDNEDDANDRSQQQPQPPQQPRQLQSGVGVGGDPIPATTTTFIDATNCTILTALNTTYQFDRTVRPYAGLMFSLATKAESVDILSLELDVRTDLARSAKPSQVQVYTVVGRFEEIISNATAWTLIADTTLIPAPEGVGSIIPLQAFATVVSVTPGSRQSFYIAMDEALLDSNVNALIKRDEVATNGDHFDLYAGAGFDPTNTTNTMDDDPLLFPTEWSTVTDPFFTGIIHYRTAMSAEQASQCAERNDLSSSSSPLPPLVTYVIFDFTLDQSLDGATLQQLPSVVEKDIDDLFATMITSEEERDQPLRDLITNHAFQRGGPVQTEIFALTGQCPPELPECAIIMRVTVPFSFLSSSSSSSNTNTNTTNSNTTNKNMTEKSEGMVQYTMYRYTEQMTTLMAAATNEILATGTTTTTTSMWVYIGNKDVRAAYDLTLTGVPPGVELTAVEQQYFLEITMDFLKKTVPSYQILAITLDEQIPRNPPPVSIPAVRRRQLRTLRDDDNDGDSNGGDGGGVGVGRELQLDFLASGSIDIAGSILASYPPLVFPDGLGTAVEVIFRDQSKIFVNKLNRDWMRPGVTTVSAGADFFTDASDIDGRVETDLTVDATPEDTGETAGGGATGGESASSGGSDGGGSGAPIIPIVAAVGGVFLFIVLYYVFRYCRRKKRIDKEKEQLRLDRKKQDDAKALRRQRELDKMKATPPPSRSNSSNNGSPNANENDKNSSGAPMEEKAKPPKKKSQPEQQRVAPVRSRSADCSTEVRLADIDGDTVIPYNAMDSPQRKAKKTLPTRSKSADSSAVGDLSKMAGAVETIKASKNDVVPSKGTRASEPAVIPTVRSGAKRQSPQRSKSAESSTKLGDPNRMAAPIKPTQNNVKVSDSPPKPAKDPAPKQNNVFASDSSPKRAKDPAESAPAHSGAKRNVPARSKSADSSDTGDLHRMTAVRKQDAVAADSKGGKKKVSNPKATNI